MDLAFWDCGGVQAVVGLQSGEFQKVHGAPEAIRGGPWEFRDGLLHGSTETVDPRSLLEWDVTRGDGAAFSLTHKTSGATIPGSVAQNVVDAKVLQFPVQLGGSSSSSEAPPSKLFQTEAFWATAPTAFADGEPMNLWVPFTSVVTFLWTSCPDQKQKICRCYEAWERVLSKCGVDTQHLQRSLSLIHI